MRSDFEATAAVISVGVAAAGRLLQLLRPACSSTRSTRLICLTFTTLGNERIRLANAQAAVRQAFGAELEMYL